MVTSASSEPATRGQRWALFCLTRTDYRDQKITKEEASSLIGSLMERKRKCNLTEKDNFQELYDKAHAAGIAAAQSHTPTPMVVVEHTNMLDDHSPIKRAYGPIMDGVCGFAWIIVKPGNGAFARWLKEHNLARKDSYYGGVNVWVSQFNQSYERKMKYASAFAKVLVDAGIKAYSDGRLD